MGNLVIVFCNRHLHYFKKVFPFANYFSFLVCRFCLYVVSGWKYGCITLWHSILCNSFERIGSILGDINYCKTIKKKGAITPSLTAQKAIDAYVGTELWKNVKFIEAELSVRGLAFTLKRRPFFKHAKLIMEIDKPYSILTPIGKNTKE
ncbi:MAG: hypothetical protein ACPH94_07785 [Flavobacteriaceae bacterium]